MALPKGFRNDIRLTSPNVGVQRRQDLLDNIADDGTFLPRGVHYQDMDETFIKFVNKELNIEIDGEGVPVVFLTLQRYAEFTKTWKFTDEYKNIKIPFITIVRKPDPQVGTNQAGLYNIPGRPTFTYYKVPTNDGARVGVDLYKIPQPTSVDITYEVRMFTNKMSDLNLLNEKVQKKFQSKQAYIWPKGHPMPVTLEGIGDESNIDDFENRRFYVQPFEMLLAGYILDEEDFEIMPTINRAMVMSELIVSDGVTTPVTDGRNSPGCVVAAQGSSVIKNTAGTVLSVVECGSNYVVGTSLVFNSGSTYSQIIPATTNLELPNVINIDSDGSSVLTPAMVGFTASTCDPVTIINSGATYTASTAAGTTFELPNQVIDIENETGGTISNITFPVYSDPTINLTAYCQSVIVNNSGGTFNQTIEPGSAYTLPNVTNIDIDGSSVLTPAQTPFTASTCTPCVSRAWVRNPNWLAMPSLSDGDNIIYILSAVKDAVNNFFSFTSTLTSGSYTVDLYNDGTTVTTHASAAQADFNLLYSKGTAEITTNGNSYKQVITKITGNFLYPSFYVKHASISNAAMSGILSVKMASQTATSLKNAFLSNGTNVRHNRLEDFEYVGTCNVTNITNLVLDSVGVGKVTGNFSAVTSMQTTFRSTSNINFDDMQINPSSGFYRQTFVSSAIEAIFNQDFFKGATDFNQTFSGAKWLRYMGTPSTPLDFTGGTAMTQGFLNCTALIHAYFQNCVPTSLSGTFQGCGSIETISGIDCTNLTNATNAFLYCSSLETLEISNMGISFSLEDCNFNQAGLVNVFNDLPSATATITITDNPGVGDLTAANIAIAEDKNWTVTT
tara:strand:- start:189 stop:2711 length:2523 start_codon:yes stop_codon:yes gene_type:complete